MDKLIESFYNDYNALDKSEEEKKILRNINKLEKNLYSTLNEEQST